MEKRMLLKRQAAKVHKVKAQENPVRELEVREEQALDMVNGVIQSLKAITTYDKSALDLQIAALRAVVGLLEPEKA